MSRNRHIYFILTLSIKCSEHPEYLENFWKEGIRNLVHRWTPRFVDDYSVDQMAEDVIDICSPTKVSQRKSLYWYRPPSDCSINEAIRLTTINLFETLNYYFYHESPLTATVSREIIEGVLGYELYVPVDDFNLECICFEQIREIIAEGTKDRLCDWLGENRVVNPVDSLYLLWDKFPFRKPGLMFMIKDLNHSDLFEYIDIYECQWESLRGQNQRKDLFREINVKLWEKIIEGTSSVWEG